MAALLACSVVVAFQPAEPPVSRRQALTAVAATLLTARPDRVEAARSSEARVEDWKGHSSFYGLAAPPIQGELTYEQLLRAADAGHIATVQIAVQHDNVIATTPEGHRFSCPIKDKDFPLLQVDAMRSDGSLPFEVLPLDPIRDQIHKRAFDLTAILGVLYLADELDLLPWDTTNYGSVKEREEADERRLRGEAPKRQPFASKKPLAAALKTLIAKLDDPKEAFADKILPKGQPAKKDDEALRRVLGLTKWDAAEELKAKVKRQVLESKAHKQVVQTHDRVVRAHNDLVLDLKTAIRDAEWITPKSLDSTITLPPLEELYTASWYVGRQGQVAQYIRAHPQGEQREDEGAKALAVRINPPRVDRGARGHPLPSLGLVMADASNVPSYSRYRTFESESGFCRLCPEFSRLYGHHVYICKTSVPA